MATRTPGLQARSQYGSYWGQYANAAALPNASGNPLANPYFAQLEAGDTALVTGVGTFTCTNPGTLGGGDAVWITPPIDDPNAVIDTDTYDSGSSVYATSAAAVSVEVRQARAGKLISIVRADVGSVTFSEIAPAVIRYPAAFTPVAAERWSRVVLEWHTATEIVLSGDLTPV